MGPQPEHGIEVGVRGHDPVEMSDPSTISAFCGLAARVIGDRTESKFGHP